MELQEKLKGIDTNKKEVATLESGVVIKIPRLSNLMVIKLAKFLAFDGYKLYGRYQELVRAQLTQKQAAVSEEQGETDTQEPVFLTQADNIQIVAQMIEEIPEKTLISVLAILLDISSEEALDLDVLDTLEIVDILSDKIDFKKLFTRVRKLADKFMPQQAEATAPATTA